MSHKFIITESERIQIRGLYEQPIKPTQDVSKLFTQEEIENGHMLFMQKDKFNNKIQIGTSGWMTFFKSINGNNIEHWFSIQVRGRGDSSMKGVFLLFEDGTKLLKPNAYVKNAYNRGPVMDGYITNLSQNEINLFKTKKIQTYKVYDNQEDLDDSYAVSLIKDVNIITKITAQNFDSVKQLFDKEDPVKNYDYSDDSESDKKTVNPQINADFPGGEKSLDKYISYYLKDKIPTGEYDFNMTISIGKDGNVNDVKMMSTTNNKYLEMFINMFKTGPKWKPAVMNGSLVDSNYTFNKKIKI